MGIVEQQQRSIEAAQNAHKTVASVLTSLFVVLNHDGIRLFIASRKSRSSVKQTDRSPTAPLAERKFWAALIHSLQTEGRAARQSVADKLNVFAAQRAATYKASFWGNAICCTSAHAAVLQIAEKVSIACAKVTMSSEDLARRILEHGADLDAAFAISKDDYMPHIDAIQTAILRRKPFDIASLEVEVEWEASRVSVATTPDMTTPPLGGRGMSREVKNLTPS